MTSKILADIATSIAESKANPLKAADSGYAPALFVISVIKRALWQINVHHKNIRAVELSASVPLPRCNLPFPSL
jgi:hypothetical protein